MTTIDAQMARHVESGEPDGDWDDVQRIHREYTGHLAPEQTVTLLTALSDVKVRDRAAVRLTDDTALAMWAELSRRAPRGDAAPAAVLAVAALMRDKPTLVHAALSMALVEDPTYTLALLVRQIMAAGVPTVELVALLGGLEL